MSYYLNVHFQGQRVNQTLNNERLSSKTSPVFTIFALCNELLDCLAKSQNTLLCVRLVFRYIAERQLLFLCVKRISLNATWAIHTLCSAKMYIQHLMELRWRFLYLYISPYSSRFQDVNNFAMRFLALPQLFQNFR